MRIGGNVILKRLCPVVLAVLLIGSAAGLAEQGKNKGGQTTRSVQGVVTGPDEAPVVGAVVQLKNLKNLAIRSFITQEKGEYYFHELSTDVDYELSARSDNMTSGTKTLSSFDSRKEAIINLKLNPAKK